MCNIIYPFLDEAIVEKKFDVNGHRTNNPSKNTLQVTCSTITKLFIIFSVFMYRWFNILQLVILCTNTNTHISLYDNIIILKSNMTY